MVNYAAALAVVVLIIAIIFMADFFSKGSSLQESTPMCLEGNQKACATPEGYTGSQVCQNGRYAPCIASRLESCEVDNFTLSRVCCRLDDGSVVDCAQKKTFSAGEFVITKINIKRAYEQSGLGWNSYKVCGFSELVPESRAEGSRYTSFYDPNWNVICSTEIGAGSLRRGTLDGRIGTAQGSITLAEWRAYPSSTDLSTAQKAFDSINSSIAIFRLEAKVSEAR